MEEATKKQIERYQNEFEQKFNKSTWTREDVENMKDLKKLEYYTKVICAMDDGGNYPGSEYIEQRGMSYANQNRSPVTGRYTSGNMSGHYPMYYDSSNGNMSGRRYYDDERMNAMEELRRMHQMQQNPEVRMALEQALRNLEAR